jgi:hypothetical protein
MVLIEVATTRYSRENNERGYVAGSQIRTPLTPTLTDTYQRDVNLGPE